MAASLPQPYCLPLPVASRSLVPCLVLPNELRKTTEGTPKEDLMTKKALFLRLIPKKVDLIPEKVVSLPKKKLTPFLKRF